MNPLLRSVMFYVLCLSCISCMDLSRSKSHSDSGGIMQYVMISSGKRGVLENSSGFRGDPTSEKYDRYIKQRFKDLVSPGDISERYILSSKILGEGGIGKVYAATDINTFDSVAVKYINLETVEDEVFRIANEIEIMTILSPEDQPSHSNIVKYYESFLTPDDKLLIVMELLSTDLFHAWQPALANNIQIPEAVLASIAKQIMSGLEFLHEHNIIHRDLKHENVMIDEKGTLKLVDFGMSLIRRHHGLSTTWCGTPTFMAPQVCNGEPYDDRADSYSVGMIILQMAMGDPQIDLRDENDVDNYLMMNVLLNGWSEKLFEFLSGCLQPDQAKRKRVSELLYAPFVQEEADDLINVGEFFEAI